MLYAWTLTRKILVKVLAEFSITTTKPQIEWKHQMLRFIEKKNQLNLSDRRILADVHLRWNLILRIVNFSNGLCLNFTKLNPLLKPFPKLLLSLRVVNSLVLCNFVMHVLLFILWLLEIIQFFSITTKLPTLGGIHFLVNIMQNILQIRNCEWIFKLLPCFVN